jgi:hypothetical protein
MLTIQSRVATLLSELDHALQVSVGCEAFLPSKEDKLVARYSGMFSSEPKSLLSWRFMESISAHTLRASKCVISDTSTAEYG